MVIYSRSWVYSLVVKLMKISWQCPASILLGELANLSASVGLENLSLVSSTVAVRNGTIIGRYATVCVAV